jgi:hypothetical protein
MRTRTTGNDADVTRNLTEKLRELAISIRRTCSGSYWSDGIGVSTDSYRGISLGSY